MLTRRGWSVAISAVVFVVAGRVLGLVELYVVAAVIVFLCAACLVLIGLRRVEVSARRSLHPPRVHAGTSSRVELELTNGGRRRTPLLSVQDPFDGGWRWARFLSPPLAAGGTSRAAYRLPTDERGIFDIGPLELSTSDPFGLVTRRFETTGVTQLTVYPRVDVIDPLPAAHGHDPHSGSQHPRALLGAGDEFYALRPYEIGDDLRRVHWASTARVDDLMIRQDEMPWQTRATVLLDVRERVHTHASLELAVSAAASIQAASQRERALIRVLTSEGTDSGFAAGHAHAEAILEHLATVQAARDDRLAGVVASLRRAGNGGSLAIITTDLAPAADLEAMASLRGRYGMVVLVLIERSAHDPGARARSIAVPSTSRLVRVTSRTPFASAWQEAMRSPVGSHP